MESSHRMHGKRIRCKGKGMMMTAKEHAGKLATPHRKQCLGVPAIFYSLILQPIYPSLVSEVALRVCAGRRPSLVSEQIGCSDCACQSCAKQGMQSASLHCITTGRAPRVLRARLWAIAECVRMLVQQPKSQGAPSRIKLTSRTDRS